MADPALESGKPAPHEVALKKRRRLLLEYAKKIRYQVGLLPDENDDGDRRDCDERGKPLNSLQAINQAVKLLSVELRHEFPLPPPGDGDPDGEKASNVSDDPLSGLVLKISRPPCPEPAKKKRRKA